MCRLRNIAMCDYQESVTTKKAWLPERRTDGRTDRQTNRQAPDIVISMCRYASQATQLSAPHYEDILKVDTSICKCRSSSSSSFFRKLSTSNSCSPDVKHNLIYQKLYIWFIHVYFTESDMYNMYNIYQFDTVFPMDNALRYPHDYTNKSSANTGNYVWSCLGKYPLYCMKDRGISPDIHVCNIHTLTSLIIDCKTSTTNIYTSSSDAKQKRRHAAAYLTHTKTVFFLANIYDNATNKKGLFYINR